MYCSRMGCHELEGCEEAIVQELRKLQLELLDTAWIKEVTENDFIQCEDLPVPYDEVSNEIRIVKLLQNLYKAAMQWIKINHSLQNESNRESVERNQESIEPREDATSTSVIIPNVESSNRGSHLWKLLFQEEKIGVDGLLALLGFFIDRGSPLSCDSIHDRERSFHAANVYFAMISIPGSMAFRMFHQMLFTKALKLINLYIEAVTHSAKPLSASQKKNKQSATQEADEEDEAIIGKEEISLIEKLMPVYLSALQIVSENLSFKRYPNILKETVEDILRLISLGQGPCSLRALQVVQNFCSPIHGDAVRTVHHIFIHVLPYLIMDSNQKILSNKDLAALKDTSFSLVHSFVNKFGATVYPLVKGLIKHVCFEVVDKAEFRQKTACTVLEILNLLPESQHHDISKWFYLLGFSDQAFLRMFSIEVFTLLLHQDRLNILGVAVIFCQCSDPSATVKAKALSILGECVESNEPNTREIFKSIFMQPANELVRAIQAEGEAVEEIENRIVGILQNNEALIASPDLLPKATAIIDLLKERCVDDKVFVRKNSLQLLLTIVQRHERYLNQELLKLLGSACRDAAMLIRRHMAQMLTDLVHQFPENKDVHHTWAQYVLPLVLDGETRVQEKALESTDQLILHSLVGADSQLAWDMLEVITNMGYSVYLSKAIEIASRTQQLPNKLMRTLQSNVEVRPQPALTLMAVVSIHATIDNTIKGFIMEYLENNLGSTDPGIVYCLQQVYKILGAAIPSMSEEQRDKIRSLSTSSVSNFSLPLELIASACDMTVYCIQQQYENEDDARKAANVWGTEILISCGEYLRNHLRKSEPVSLDEEEQLAKRILTLGCVGIHCPGEVNKRHFLLLQHAAFQPESGVDAPIPSSQIQSQPIRCLPPRLQAGAIISLGKLSYQHEEIAKQLIPGLGRLLETTPHRAVRNNIVCVLCDWIVRYATAIDPVMPQVTACLRDPFPEIRKQTLILLIHLLQEDYLKIRGTFFFRILQLGCDDDEALKDLALFYITQRLLHRQPTIIQQHFVESIFHFNDYKGHPTYNKYSLTEREKKLFSIAGTAHSQRRYDIYMFMLQNMDDEARFQLTYRITRDVLNGVVEDVMSLKNASTEAVLKDALAVLSSDNIKLASLTTPTEDDPIDKEDVAQAIVQSTKKAIIAQVVKRNVIENIVPIVVALKRKLAAVKSTLMGNLMQFLRELMKDYKDEIQEVLAEDKQLMAEIEFDLKRFEQQEKMETLRQSVANRPEKIATPPEMANTRNDNAAPAFADEQLNNEVQAEEPVAPEEASNGIQEGNSSAIEKEAPIEDREINPDKGDEGLKEGTTGKPECEAPEPAGEVQPHKSKDRGVRQARMSGEKKVSELSNENQNQAEVQETIPVRRSSRGQKNKGDMTQQLNLPADDVENEVRTSRESNQPPVETGANREDGNKSQRRTKRSAQERPDGQTTMNEKSFAEPGRRSTRVRLLQPKVFISTPVRNIPVDEVSFNIRDADISRIPHVEPKAKRRRI